jgi:hypothetical protein
MLQQLGFTRVGKFVKSFSEMHFGSFVSVRSHVSSLQVFKKFRTIILHEKINFCFNNDLNLIGYLKGNTLDLYLREGRLEPLQGHRQS